MSSGAPIPGGGGGASNDVVSTLLAQVLQIARQQGARHVDVARVCAAIEASLASDAALSAPSDGARAGPRLAFGGDAPSVRIAERLAAALRAGLQVALDAMTIAPDDVMPGVLVVREGGDSDAVDAGATLGMTIASTLGAPEAVAALDDANAAARRQRKLIVVAQGEKFDEIQREVGTLASTLGADLAFAAETLDPDSTTPDTAAPDEAASDATMPGRSAPTLGATSADTLGETLATPARARLRIDVLRVRGDLPGHDTLSALAPAAPNGGVRTAVDALATAGGDVRVDELVGTLIRAKYRILRRIGSGGFGAVYEARDESIGRRVAIKILHRAAARRAQSLENFRDEARRLTQLEHLNIVNWKVFDQAEDGVFFFVMELLEGDELKKTLETNKRIEPKRAARIALQILDALRTAHHTREGEEILHLDLKPKNVILVTGPRGEPDWVKLIDFGIGRSRRTESSSRGSPSRGGAARDSSAPSAAPRATSDDLDATKGTEFGGLSGITPEYASPEHCALWKRVNGAVELDGRADVYSVGVIAFEMLAGQLPFEKIAQRDQMIAARIQKPARKLRSVAPDVPRKLAEFVDRCLEHDRDARWKSAEHAYAALDALLHPNRLPWILAGAAAVVLGAVTYALLKQPAAASASDTPLLEIARGADARDATSAVDGAVYFGPRKRSAVLAPDFAAFEGQGTSLPDEIRRRLASSDARARLELAAATPDDAPVDGVTADGATRDTELDLSAWNVALRDGNFAVDAVGTRGGAARARIVVQTSIGAVGSEAFTLRYLAAPSEPESELRISLVGVGGGLGAAGEAAIARTRSATSDWAWPNATELPRIEPAGLALRVEWTARRTQEVEPSLVVQVLDEHDAPLGDAIETALERDAVRSVVADDARAVWSRSLTGLLASDTDGERRFEIRALDKAGNSIAVRRTAQIVRRSLAIVSMQQDGLAAPRRLASGDVLTLAKSQIVDAGASAFVTVETSRPCSLAGARLTAAAPRPAIDIALGSAGATATHRIALGDALLRALERFDRAGAGLQKSEVLALDLEFSEPLVSSETSTRKSWSFPACVAFTLSPEIDLAAWLGERGDRRELSATSDALPSTAPILLATSAQQVLTIHNRGTESVDVDLRSAAWVRDAAERVVHVLHGDRTVRVAITLPADGVHELAIPARFSNKAVDADAEPSAKVFALRVACDTTAPTLTLADAGRGSRIDLTPRNADAAAPRLRIHPSWRAKERAPVEASAPRATSDAAAEAARSIDLRLDEPTFEGSAPVVIGAVLLRGGESGSGVSWTSVWENESLASITPYASDERAVEIVLRKELFATAKLANGMYELRLHATDAVGQRSSDAELELGLGWQSPDIYLTSPSFSEVAVGSATERWEWSSERHDFLAKVNVRSDVPMRAVALEMQVGNHGWRRHELRPSAEGAAWHANLEAPADLDAWRDEVCAIRVFATDAFGTEWPSREYFGRIGKLEDQDYPQLVLVDRTRRSDGSAEQELGRVVYVADNSTGFDFQEDCRRRHAAAKVWSLHFGARDIDAFYLMDAPVSGALFARFLDALTSGAAHGVAPSRLDKLRALAAAAGDGPMYGVELAEAQACCEWLGGALPTYLRIVHALSFDASLWNSWASLATSRGHHYELTWGRVDGTTVSKFNDPDVASSKDEQCSWNRDPSHVHGEHWAVGASRDYAVPSGCHPGDFCDEHGVVAALNTSAHTSFRCMFRVDHMHAAVRKLDGSVIGVRPPL